VVVFPVALHSVVHGWKNVWVAKDGCVVFLQARSRTSVRGRAVNGGSPDPTSWHVITGNIQVPSHSNAATATGVSQGQIIWHSTWRDTTNQHILPYEMPKKRDKTLHHCQKNIFETKSKILKKYSLANIQPISNGASSF